MIIWKKVSDEPMPKDKAILALFKGQFCITEFDEEKNHWWMCWMPSAYDRRWSVKDEFIAKFTHWASLEYPEDY